MRLILETWRYVRHRIDPVIIIFDGLVQYCSISSAWAMEILQSFTKPSISGSTIILFDIIIFNCKSIKFTTHDNTTWNCWQDHCHTGLTHLFKNYAAKFASIFKTRFSILNDNTYIFLQAAWRFDLVLWCCGSWRIITGSTNWCPLI